MVIDEVRKMRFLLILLVINPDSYRRDETDRKLYDLLATGVRLAIAP